jgi:hypothetical protein
MTAIKQHREKEDIDRQKIEKLPYEVSTVSRRLVACGSIRAEGDRSST